MLRGREEGMMSRGLAGVDRGENETRVLGRGAGGMCVSCGDGVSVMNGNGEVRK